MNNLPLYRYSYSGTDARTLMYFEGRGDLITPVESVHTISWSVHEATGDARALGFRGVKGFGKGVVTIGGSLITTIIEDNPLADVMEMLNSIANDPSLIWPSWSIDKDMIGVGTAVGHDFNRRLVRTMPPINILVQYATEGSIWKSGNELMLTGASWLLKGVTFVDESLVTSTSDSATEQTYSFKALDCKPISKQEFEQIVTNTAPVNSDIASDALLRARLTSESNATAEQYKGFVKQFNDSRNILSDR